MCVCVCVRFSTASHKHNHLLPCGGGRKRSIWSSSFTLLIRKNQAFILGPIRAGENIVSFDYEGRDADLDSSYMLMCMLSE